MHFLLFPSLITTILYDFNGISLLSFKLRFYQCYPATGMPDDQGKIMSPGTKPRDGHCHVTSAADGMGTSSGSWHRCHFSKSDWEVRESHLAARACSGQEKFFTLRKKWTSPVDPEDPGRLKVKVLSACLCADVCVQSDFLSRVFWRIISWTRFERSYRIDKSGALTLVCVDSSVYRLFLLLKCHILWFGFICIYDICSECL